MMITTILLICLLISFVALLLYFIFKSDDIFTRRHLMILGAIAAVFIVVLLQAGPDKIKSDLVRLFNNSIPKSADEIYLVLFGKPVDTCVGIVNLKDQVVPQIDCCIWMEVRMCPAEMRKISSRNDYSTRSFLKTDSVAFLQNFPDRPKWWKPQLFSGTIVALHFKRSDRNQQYIFLNSDSTHAFVCDIAI